MNPETKSKAKSKLFEHFMLIFATVEPLATIPQIINIWVGHNTSGVSLSTWFFYTLTSAIWLIYGLKTKDTPITVSGALWVASQGLVVIGILLN